MWLMATVLDSTDLAGGGGGERTREGEIDGSES